MSNVDNEAEAEPAATEEHLKELSIVVNGYAQRCDNLDEDISVSGVVKATSNSHQTPTRQVLRTDTALFLTAPPNPSRIPSK